MGRPLPVDTGSHHTVRVLKAGVFVMKLLPNPLPLKQSTHGEIVAKFAAQRKLCSIVLYRIVFVPVVVTL